MLELGWPPDLRDRLKTTALQLAAQAGHYGTSEALLNYGANPEAVDSIGRNSLLFACCAPEAGVAMLLI